MNAVAAPSITNAEFARFQALIYKLAGISLSDAKKVLLVGRLSKRLKAHELDTFTEYYKLVTSPGGADESQSMVDLLTTNETYFFREEKHFEYLSAKVLAQHPAGRPFDIWSAACSTGEEVYTLAMVLAEKLGLHAPWTITGSDISTVVLEKAQRAQYPMERARGTPTELLRKYCLKGVRDDEGTFLISQPLRKHIRFMQVNLNVALPEVGSFDVIFLRNVMIYFDPETKRAVVARLITKLKQGGYFIVGHAESLHGITEALQPVQATIYRKP
jgi:chemotaxis protein methyltransferase CheR